MGVGEKGVSSSLRASKEIEDLDVWAVTDPRGKMILWNDFSKVVDYSLAVIFSSLILEILALRSRLGDGISTLILERVRFTIFGLIGFLQVYFI